MIVTAVEAATCSFPLGERHLNSENSIGPVSEVGGGPLEDGGMKSRWYEYRYLTAAFT
jgi:hypothetical protein